MRLCRCVFWVGFLGAMLSFQGLAQADKTSDGIMVWRLEGNENIKEADVTLLSSFMAAQVAQYSDRKVISEADISTVLKGEETKQRCGLEDNTCMVEIGNALGVQEAVSGDVGKIGSFWILNLRRINVRSAKSISRCSRSLEGSMDSLIRELPGAVAELFGKEASSSAPAQAAKEVSGTAEPKPTVGTLIVKSKPDGANVFMGGMSLGKTPLRSSLKEGEYSLRISKEDFEEEKRILVVKAGEKTELFVKMRKLKPGRLIVLTEPDGATLSLGGMEMGTTPYEYGKLMPGEYELALTLPGYVSIEERIDIEAKQTTTKKYLLERDYPMNPYKKYGYVSFFTGAGLVLFGGLATWQAQEAADEVKSGTWGAEGTNVAWSGVAITGYVLGAGGMATGIVLWVLSPGDKEWWEKHNVSAAVTPDGQGATLSLQGRW